ncbi:ThuA domain-containing protein [uncultured Sphingomonas sp.]|uniref:ThuA domain-containing protein n=1 Tax=uncultured Sphingomonas sp. TaxID=158754 RepID=UPI00262AB899|nr:ThuA domain-containing protein [uncultured Sphingomonas sp.]
MIRFALALLALLVPGTAWAQAQYKLLVLAIPNKYHYEYIPIARDSLEHLAKLHAFEMVWTNKTETFDGDLSQYAAVMFLNTPGEELNPGQRAKFEAYMRAGGNAIVVHRAAITPPDAWPWYERLVGRRVGVHPMLQTGIVTVTDREHPASYGVPERWIWSDEFYTTTNPYKVNISTILSVDETSYDPRKIWPGQVSLPMGRDHPIAWHHLHEKGRVFVTTLGHNGEMYRDPQYLAHLMGGLWWAATGMPRR